MNKHIKTPEFHPICTPGVIREFVEFIEKISEDDERAHTCEDALYAYIIRSIALKCCEDPVNCCKEAISTEKINFARWCA